MSIWSEEDNRMSQKGNIGFEREPDSYYFAFFQIKQEEDVKRAIKKFLGNKK